MTDNEIIKALECCVNDDEGVRGFCNKGCPLFGKDANCPEVLRKNALAIIKHQKAEIERLKDENTKQKAVIEQIEDSINPLPFVTDFDKTITEAKTEAIKELAKRLKEHSRKMQSSDFSGEFWDKAVLVSDIDNLVKEMAGDDNEKA